MNLFCPFAGYISGYHDQLLIGFLALMAYLVLIIQIVKAILLRNIVGKDMVSYLYVVIPFFPSISQILSKWQ